MSLNTTPRTWVTAEVVTAAYMNTEVRDAFTGLQAGWTSYTPTLTAATTNPTAYVGTGRWLQIGKTVLWKACITFNGAATGTGAYSLLLPASPENAMAAGYRHTFQGVAFHSGVYPIFCQTTGANPAPLFFVNAVGGAAATALTQNSMVAFANGDTISVSGQFETT